MVSIYPYVWAIVNGQYIPLCVGNSQWSIYTPYVSRLRDSSCFSNLSSSSFLHVSDKVLKV